MAHFRGTVRGDRGDASRCGSKRSGLEVIAASWHGAIRVILEYDKSTDSDNFTIELIPWGSFKATELLAKRSFGTKEEKDRVKG